jgi:hypothetical protein
MGIKNSGCIRSRCFCVGTVLSSRSIVEISFIPFVSAGSLRLPSKTADHFAVSPLQNETAVSFWFISLLSLFQSKQPLRLEPD